MAQREILFPSTLIRVISTTRSYGGQNTVVLRTPKNVSKPELRCFLEALVPGAKIARINTMNYAGKTKQSRRFGRHKRADWKKAIVTFESEATSSSTTTTGSVAAAAARSSASSPASQSGTPSA